MTGPQKSYLPTLAQVAGRDAPAGELSKADASKLIDERQVQTGRGRYLAVVSDPIIGVMTELDRTCTGRRRATMA